MHFCCFTPALQLLVVRDKSLIYLHKDLSVLFKDAVTKLIFSRIEPRTSPGTVQVVKTEEGSSQIMWSHAEEPGCTALATSVLTSRDASVQTVVGRYGHCASCKTAQQLAEHAAVFSYPIVRTLMSQRPSVH